MKKAIRLLATIMVMTMAIGVTTVASAAASHTYDYADSAAEIVGETAAGLWALPQMHGMYTTTFTADDAADVPTAELTGSYITVNAEDSNGWSAYSAYEATNDVTALISGGAANLGEIRGNLDITVSYRYPVSLAGTVKYAMISLTKTLSDTVKGNMAVIAAAYKESDVPEEVGLPQLYTSSQKTIADYLPQLEEKEPQYAGNKLYTKVITDIETDLYAVQSDLVALKTLNDGYAAATTDGEKIMWYTANRTAIYNAVSKLSASVQELHDTLYGYRAVLKSVGFAEDEVYDALDKVQLSADRYVAITELTGADSTVLSKYKMDAAMAEQLLVVSVGTVASSYADSTVHAVSTKTVGLTAEIKLGDLNDDTKINMKDVLLVRKLVAGIESKSSTNAFNGDVNSDGKNNMKDVLNIRRYVAGVITSFD